MRLSSQLTSLAQSITARTLIKKKAFFVDAVDLVTDETYKKLNLDAQVMRAEADPIFLKMVVGDSTWTYPLEVHLSKKNGRKMTRLSRMYIPDTRPVIWRSLSLNERHAKMNYDRLIEEFPLSENHIVNHSGVIFGYTTDTDADGVRQFISLDKKRGMFLGIDVPCDQIDKYLAEPAFTRHILTPWVEFCRIEVLKFQ